jgi:hypothetical protein
MKVFFSSIGINNTVRLCTKSLKYLQQLWQALNYDIKSNNSNVLKFLI